MSEPTLHRTTPLVWLRTEIDRSIEGARLCLARALVQQTERDALLLDGCRKVRQVRGALDVLGLEGAARFCLVLEEALGTLRTDAVKLTELHASAVDRAMFALSQFLADVAQGEADMPLKLFPVYKELNELCGRNIAAEAELFYPDIAAAPPLDARTPRIHPSTLAAHLAACCSLFQRGLVSWLKDETRLEGIGMMRSALDGLQRAIGELKIHPALWWAAAGLVDVLAHPDDRIDLGAVKITLGRIERTMRALSSGSDVDSITLMREILYPIALARPVTDRVREIKSLYCLDSHIPEFCVSGTLEYDTPALAPVLDRMRQNLERIEQTWSRCAEGTPGSLPTLREEILTFKDAARDLGHYRLVRLLDIVSMIVSKLPEAAALDSDGLSLEMASAFLFMEGMLEHFTDPPPDIDLQVTVMAGRLLDAVKPNSRHSAMSGTPRDDITQRQHFVDIRNQVVGEILENLLRVEEIVDQAARAPDTSARLSGVEKPLAQAAGALKMLGLNRASGVLAACTQLLRACASDRDAWKFDTLQWAADGLSCLGFYLDALRRGGAPNDDLLAAFVRRMANESELPAGSTGWIPASAGLVDAASEPDATPLQAPIAFEPAQPVDTATRPAPAAQPESASPNDIRAHAAPREAASPKPASVPTEPADNTPEPAPVSPAAPDAREAAEFTPPPGSDDPDPSLLPVFLDEARTLLGRLYSELAAWRSAPRDIRAARAFARTLHTLKGSARLVGAMRLGDFTHGVESNVGNAIETGDREGDLLDFAPLQHMLATLAEHIGALAGLNGRLRAPADSVRSATAHPGAPADILDAPNSVRVPISVLNGLVNHVGELSEVRARTEDDMGTLRRSLHELAETVSRLRGQLHEMEKESEREPHPRIDTAGDQLLEASSEHDRRTRLQELSRAMAESLHDVQTLQQSLVIHCAETEAALALQGRLDRNLRHKLLEIRSLPFGSLAERLRRTVRQTAAQLTREAELHIEGDTVAIDRMVLQRLAAPLEHMLRNAVAHGIEPVAVRIAAGKPPVGSIRLVIEQSEDENVLSLTDDGAGLDIAQIRAQAEHLGLIAAGECVSDRILNSLIFAPGLTTASTVTAACGRGVGLDVVRAEVRALGGSIEVSSERGGGVCFRIHFPASLSYTQALLVRSTGRLYAVPATVVEQVCELPAEALQAAREDGRIAWNGQDYRFADLTRLLGDSSQPPAPRRSNSVLLLHGDGERTALHVEQVLRKQAIELKNIGPQLARVRGIAGATIIGKGDVVLILDPDELVMHAAHRLAREARQATPPTQDAPHVILVVDDSITMRRATTRLLTRAGYRVLIARDGADALQQIEEITPDLVIADIEMPNMDGFELTSHLRSDPRTARIPIIIVTSRIAEKHQRRAADLGVDVFFGKPYAEERLLADVAALLDRRAQDTAA